jgi:L-threonylcarbamoyladenylate synthase
MPVEVSQRELERGVQVLRDGGVVAFPTDTLYGLGADVFNLDALQKVFDIKERPAGLALPVLIDNWKQFETVAADVTPVARTLAEKYWPGPLTLIVSKADAVPDLLTAGAPTVAVRVPDHPVPRALARMFGGPITGTSANRSGEADLKSLEELKTQLGPKVDYVVAAGPAPMGTASTIVDITEGCPKLIRQGVVPFEDIAGYWR